MPLEKHQYNYIVLRHIRKGEATNYVKHFCAYGYDQQNEEFLHIGGEVSLDLNVLLGVFVEHS